MESAKTLKRAQEYIEAESNPIFKEDIEKLIESNDQEALNDRFYTDLKFGTGGLRGKIGGGFNRMNSLTVQRATQGLANYIKKTVPSDKSSVVIAYDNRNYSDLFALEAAKVLCGAGIKTYLFSALRPTPELSFAVRHLSATAGIVITASHNPPEYNGYKVYWDDGSQIVAPHDKAIVEEVLAVENVTALSKEKAREAGLLIMIDKELDDPYIAMVKGLAIRPDLLAEKGRDLKVVFTPLHGTGMMPVSRALLELGIEVIFVEEQKNPDGNFPTVASPNPEEASALKMAMELAKEKKADLVLATDPDADRLGIAVPNSEGEFVLINGNQLGSLLAEYVLSGLKEQNKLPEDAAMVKTIVTTELQRRIASYYGAACFDVLTGFKFIGDKIREFEATQKHTYVFGGEESYGYLVGTNVRDKDAVSSATMTAEMTLFALSQGRSLLEQLDFIFDRYGVFQETLIYKVFEGQAGVEHIKNLMSTLRNTPPKILAGQPVSLMKDYANGMVSDFKSGKAEKLINLPSSNVLQFILEDDSVITARPSGTEPKIKFYASCCEEPGVPLAEAKQTVTEKIQAIENEIHSILAD